MKPEPFNVNKALAALVLHLRNEGWTLEAIGKAAGVTRERVRQFEGMGISYRDKAS